MSSARQNLQFEVSWPLMKSFVAASRSKPQRACTRSENGATVTNGHNQRIVFVSGNPVKSPLRRYHNILGLGISPTDNQFRTGSQEKAYQPHQDFGSRTISLAARPMFFTT